MKKFTITVVLLSIAILSTFLFTNTNHSSVNKDEKNFQEPDLLTPTQQKEEIKFMEIVSKRLIDNGYESAGMLMSTRENTQDLEIIIPIPSTILNKESEQEIGKIIKQIPKPKHLLNYSITLQDINPE